MTRYATVVADPPWPYETPGGGPLQSSPTHRPQSWGNALSGVGSEKRYGVMTMDDLKGLRLPSADNAHLYLWTTNAFIARAHDLARAWGFEPKTILTWVKIRAADGQPSMKTGYYFRGATEHVVFAVRGSLRTTGTWPTAYLWPRLPHSVKPDAFYDLVEQASPGPRLELFARRKRLGWDVWGDGVDNDVEVLSAA